MERLKLAIAKARETSVQLQREQSRAATRAPIQLAAAATGHAEPKRWSRSLAAPLLLGLAAVIAYWAMSSDPKAATMPSAVQANKAPAPQVALASPPPPAELDSPTGNAASSISVKAGEPAVAAGATEHDKPPAPQNAQVEAAVEAWRRAWSARDMASYLDAYSEAFKPPAGVSRQDWVANRYRNVGGNKSIDVQIKALQVLALEEDSARVSFLQDYTSGSSRETGRPKTLDLVRDADARWRIVGEWQGEPPPFVKTVKS